MKLIESQTTKLTVRVNAEALRQVLTALVGPTHLILELRATRDKPPVLIGNPIDTLMRDFERECDALALQHLSC